MDILRSWIIATAVLLGASFVLSLIVTEHFSAVYLMGPFLAGLGASLYHAERGVGWWGRHFLAVLPAPAIVQTYWIVMQDGFPASAQHWLDLVTGLGLTTLIVALGLGTLMLARWMLSTKDTSSATSSTLGPRAAS